MDDDVDDLTQIDIEAQRAAKSIDALRASISGVIDVMRNMSGVSEYLAGALSRLAGIENGAARGVEEYSSSALDAAYSVTNLSSSSRSLSTSLQAVADAVQAAGFGPLAQNAQMVAQAFYDQQKSIQQNDSSLMGLITDTIIYVSIAASVYDTLRVVDGIIGTGILKWQHLGEAIKEVGAAAENGGGIMSALSSALSGLSGSFGSVATSANSAAGAMGIFKTVSLALSSGMKSIIMGLASATRGFASLVNQALASKTAMTIAENAGTGLGKMFMSATKTGFGLTYALSGLLNVLKSVPRMIHLCTMATMKFMAVAWPVVLPLAAIAAAILALIAAWKALKAMFSVGSTILKTLAKGFSTVVGAAWKLGKFLGGVLYEGLKIFVSGLVSAAKAIYAFYNRIRETITGALDRFAAGLYYIVPALDKASESLGKASESIERFFGSIRKDSRELQNVILRLNNTFGSNASAVELWARDYSSSVGKSFTETAGHVLAFYRSFREMGVAQRDAQEFSKTVIKAGNDIASALNISPEKSMDALASALNGDRTALYNLGIAFNDAAVEQQLFNRGIDPEKASKEQKNLATLSAALDAAGFAYNHLRDNVESYENQQRMLKNELQTTSELLGGILKSTTSAFTKTLIGAVRWTREFIHSNTEFVKKFSSLPAILTGASVALRGLSIAASAVAGALAVISGVVTVMLSPLGMLVRYMTQQLGLLPMLQNAYETAFDGAIKKSTEAFLAMRVFGISIENWFKIGAAAIKNAFFSALDMIIQKIGDLIAMLPSMANSFLRLEVAGASVGNWISRGFETAKIAALEMGAVVGTVINGIVRSAREMHFAWVRIMAAIGKANAGDLLQAGLKSVQNPVDVEGMREEIKKAKSELMLLNDPILGGGIESDLVGSIKSGLDSISESLQGLLGKAGEGLRADAADLASEIERLRASEQGAGVELDNEFSKIIERIRELSQNNPIIDDFKNNIDPRAVRDIEDVEKSSAQGTFSGQLKTDDSVAKKSLKYQKETAENTNRIANYQMAIAGY